MYMSNLVYEYPFNMNELHNRVLAKLVAETKEQADDRNFAYEVSIERLSDDKMKLMSRINEKETQIILLKNDIENHKAILATVDAHPILHKGKIKEYYAGEQRDVILNVLKDAKESEGCEKDLAELLEEILKENPTVGNRKKLIREIDILTKSTRDIKKIIPDLQKLGYVCQEEGKHVKVVFYGDTRYQTHIVKTGGVYNLRFGYREMKEHFF